VVLMLALVAATTQPAATTRGVGEKKMEGWVRDLANGDPEVRREAWKELMGIDAGELERLKEVVKRCQPLGPSQRAMLPGIVGQIYLSGEMNEEAMPGNVGFLGVLLLPNEVEIPGKEHTDGATVTGRLPGTCGYRMLEDGDVIVRIKTDQAHEVHTSDDLMERIKLQHGGDVVGLDVLRLGKMVHVELTLSQKPAWAVDALRVEQGVAEREKRASDYWEKEFAPLMEGGAS
jgi:hypothetical protein